MKYDVIRKPSDEIRVVGIKNGYRMKFGAIDSKENELLPCKYDWLRDFHNGISVFNEGGSFDKKNKQMNGGKWGIIDKQNKILVSARYDYISPFRNGYATVRLGAKYGFIDPYKRIVRALKYDRISSFSERRFAVGLQKEVKSNWIYGDKESVIENGILMERPVELKMEFGYINSDNKIVIPYQYDKALNFEDGKACVIRNNLFAYIDYDGNYLSEWDIMENHPDYIPSDDDEDIIYNSNSYLDAFDGNPEATWNID